MAGVDKRISNTASAKACVADVEGNTVNLSISGEALGMSIRDIVRVFHPAWVARKEAEARSILLHGLR